VSGQVVQGPGSLRVGRFIGRLGVVSIPAVQAWLDLDQRVVRRHVRKLETAGWLARAPWVWGEGSVVWLTAAGIESVGLGGVRAVKSPPAPTTIAHGVLVGWSAARVQQRGHVWKSARELALDADRWAVPARCERGYTLQLPDVAVWPEGWESPGAVIAESGGRREDRQKLILEGWRDAVWSGRYHAVRYDCASQSVATWIARLARKTPTRNSPPRCRQQRSRSPPSPPLPQPTRRLRRHHSRPKPRRRVTNWPPGARRRTDRRGSARTEHGRVDAAPGARHRRSRGRARTRVPRRLRYGQAAAPPLAPPTLMLGDSAASSTTNPTVAGGSHRRLRARRDGIERAKVPQRVSRQTTTATKGPGSRLPGGPRDQDRRLAPALATDLAALGQDHATHAANPRRLTRDNSEPPTTAQPAPRPPPGIDADADSSQISSRLTG